MKLMRGDLLTLLELHDFDSPVDTNDPPYSMNLPVLHLRLTNIEVGGSGDTMEFLSLTIHSPVFLVFSTVED